MRLIVTTSERQIFATEEPKIERIHLVPAEPGPVQAVQLQGCDSEQCAALQPGVVFELLQSDLVNGLRASAAALPGQVEAVRQLDAANNVLSAELNRVKDELAALKASTPAVTPAPIS